MKFRLIFSVFSLLNVFSVTAATLQTYISASEVHSPPEPAPQIDAVTWINQTVHFEVNDFSINPLPYQTANTLHFRNEQGAALLGHPGYFFEHINGNTRSRMTSWHNRGFISSSPDPASIFFFSGTLANWLLVSSDNITNSGSMHATPDGMIRLSGNTLNLTRGRFRTGNPFQGFVSGTGGVYLGRTNYFNDLGITDLYWGAGTNNVVSGSGQPMFLNLPTPNFSVTNLQSPRHDVIDTFGFTNTFNFLPSFFGFRGVMTSTYVTTNQAANQILVQTVFVTTNFFDTNVTTEITFFPDIFGGGATVQVGFKAVERDIALDVSTTNSVYLLDALALQTNATIVRNSGFGLTTRRPNSYELTKAPFGGLFSVGVSSNNSYLNFPAYKTSYGTNLVNLSYAAYSGQLSGQALPGTDPTNFPGRIEITGQNVNLREARVRAESTFILNANNLVSNSLARVSAPYVSVDVGTTQPQLLISNLAPRTVDRFYGTVSAWSGLWDNTDTDTNFAGMTIRFHVLIVDPNLQGTQPVTVNKFFGRGPQIVLHDFLTVNQRLRMDSSSLHVKSNGGLVFPANWSWGSSNMVNMANLTNEGILSVPGVAVLGPDKALAYTNVINRGSFLAQAHTIATKYFENSGEVISRVGNFLLTGTNTALTGQPITRQVIITTNIFLFPFPTTNYFTNVFYTGAATIAAQGDLTINGSSVSLSNALLQAGNGVVQGSIIINATTRLTDSGPQQPSYWFTTGGMRVPKRPTQASDLMGTYITVQAPNGTEAQVVWDGKNLSAVSLGYSNNLAVGKLTLDAGQDSRIRFSGVPGKDNAIYVDYLELLNNATNYSTGLDLPPLGLVIDEGIKIYFAHANIAADKLNGAQGNRIRWVPNFLGPLSTTNIVYPSSNIYPVNISLARAKDRDSDGDGIPNINDPTPIYTAETIGFAIDHDAQPNRVLLSWQVVTGSVSHVEYKPVIVSSGSWQLLRSTSAPANMRMNMTDITTGRTQRIYRVRVDLPPQ